MRVLVVNPGSSSIKLRILADDDVVLAEHHLQRWESEDRAPIAALLDDMDDVDAVGHRVVHGGDLVAATLINDEIERRIAALAPLAPLHQPRTLAGIRAVRDFLPDVPMVACFDTAYHATLSPQAATYALPARWRAQWGLRRYGFHGLSHQYAARRASHLMNGRTGLRVVTAHLGAGASLCASTDGRSVDTTMGFTPLEGLVMATRSGSVDPGLLLWLMTEAGLTPQQVTHALEHEAGLAGLAGGSGDMRDVLASRAAGDERAQLAFAVYVHRLAKEIAGMAAAGGGLDALIFTGGVGEHAPEVRAAVADRLGFLGIAIDGPQNTAVTEDSDISVLGAPVTTLVVEAREDLEIARQTRDLLTG